MTISPLVIFIGAIWNVLAWYWFGRAYKLPPVILLGIPFLMLAAIYGWFMLADTELILRAQWVRGNLSLVLFTQAPVLTLLAYLRSKDQRR